MAPSIKYGIYYPEGGYLHVRTLGKGVQGTACLVRSVGDGAEYVRKKTLPSTSTTSIVAGNACPEVGLYRPHPRIPKLIHYQSYPVFKPTTDQHAVTRSYSMVFEFCNGGTLARLLQIRATDQDYTPSTLLVWKLFDDLMTVVHFLHQHCTPAITHNDAHSQNVFLNYPDDHARIPNFYLGDFGLARIIDTAMWQAGGPPGERKLKSLDSVPVSDRARYKEQGQGLVNDLISVQTNVGRVMTGLTDYDTVGVEDIIPQQKEIDRWPSELFGCYDKLDDIITNTAWGNTFERYEDFGDLCRNVSTFARQEAARATESGQVQDLRGTRPGRYDWRNAGGLDLELSPELAMEHDNRPQLYDSRHELLVKSRDVPGPWRIAHVDADTLTLLGFEKLEFGYHVPTPSNWSQVMPDRLPTMVEEIGWDEILKTANRVDNREHAQKERHEFSPDQPESNDVEKLFALDPEWPALGSH